VNRGLVKIGTVRRYVLVNT